MDDFDKYMSQAERLGLKGDKITAYIQQAIERDERAKAREAQKEKEEREERARKEEREARDKERVALAQREKEAREFELRKLELETDKELKTLQLKVEGNRGEFKDSQGTGQGKKTGYIPKLPPFEEGKDDIDSFLFRFESHAKSCNWPEKEWTLYIASLFKGSALALYHNLAAKDSLTWEELKTELLKKFQCSAEGFRQKFRSVKPDKGESFTSFLIRGSHFLDRWIDLSKTNKDFNGLKDLLIREQILHSVSKDLAVFLREREFKSAEEMCEAADRYQKAHPDKLLSSKGDFTVPEVANVAFESYGNDQGYYRGNNFRGRNQFRTGGRQQYGYYRGDNQRHFQGQYQNRGSRVPVGKNRGWNPRIPRSGFTESEGYTYQDSNTGTYSKSGQNFQSDKEPRCFKCDGKYHVKKDCPVVSPKKAHKANVADTFVYEQAHALTTSKDDVGLLLEKCSVNGIEAKVLRDTGCTTAGVRKKLVLPEQYLGSTQTCKTFGGKFEIFPLARINVDTQYYSGVLDACVIEEPICDLILGNVQNVKTGQKGRISCTSLYKMPERDVPLNVDENITVDYDTDVHDGNDVDMSEMLSLQFVPEVSCAEERKRMQNAERKESVREEYQANVGVLNEGEKEECEDISVCDKDETLDDVVTGSDLSERTIVERMFQMMLILFFRQVRSMLGLLFYYMTCIKDFVTVKATLTDLTKGDKTRQIKWSSDCQTDLEKVQRVLNSYPVLLLPTLTEDFVLRTDASSKGMGAVLLQEKEGILHPVQYASKKFSETQKGYSTVERECLATVWGCEKFARFLVGREFILQTDHRPLTFLKSSKTKNNRLLRWSLRLQEFRFRVEHLPGNSNVMADLLSRERS